MSSDPHYLQLLEDLREIHARKSADYASPTDPQENFKRAETIASWFTEPADQVYATMIGIKLARLASLKRDGRSPQNESLADTHLDLAAYAALWAARERAQVPERCTEEILALFETGSPGEVWF